MSSTSTDLIVVSALLLAAQGIGGRLCRLFATPDLDQRTALLIHLAVGLGALALSIFVLGVVGLLAPIPLAAVLAAGILVGLRDLGRLSGELRRSWRTFEAKGSREANAVTLIVLLLVAAVLVMAALAPPTDWDSLMYHLEIPREFLESGRFLVPADNLHVAFVGLAHMLYLPLLALGSPAGPSLLNVALSLALAVAVVRAGDGSPGSPTGSVAMLLYWGMGAVALVAATARTDVTLALYVFLAHYASLLWLEDTADRRWLWFAAILGGLAIGVKYHALAYLAPLGAVLLIEARRSSKVAPAELTRVLALCLGVMGLLSAPWFLKNLWMLGAPLYPFLSDPRLPPWLAAAAGVETVPSGVNVFSGLGQVREGWNVLDLFLRPERLSVEAEGPFYNTHLAFLLAPLGLLYLRDSRIRMLLVPPVAYLLALLVPFDGTNLRYLIVAAPALALVTVEGARRLLARWLSPPAVRWALLSGALVGLLPTALGAGRSLVSDARFLVATGAITPATYLSNAPTVGFPTYYRVARRVDELVEQEQQPARILLLFEGRGFYFSGEVLQDNVLANWPLATAIDLTSDCLRGAGVTHVLVNLGVLHYYRSRGLDPATLEWHRFPSFRDRCLEEVFSGGGYEFYRVRGSDPPG